MKLHPYITISTTEGRSELDDLQLTPVSFDLPAPPEKKPVEKIVVLKPKADGTPSATLF